MKIKADLHNHLTTSTKGIENLDFDETIDYSLKKLGNGILGLINFSDSRYEKFIQKKGYERTNLENAVYIPQKDFLIIKGQEVPTKQGHILVLGIKENFHLKEKRNLEDSLKEAKDLNGIVILDHPFYYEGIGDYLFEKIRITDAVVGYFSLDYRLWKKDIIKQIDGIEVHNGEANYIPFLTSFFPNKEAKKFYKEHLVFTKSGIYPEIGAISTSDGHSIREIGSSYTLLEKPSYENSEKLVESLKKSIREHTDYSQDKQHHSILGTYEHLFKLAGLITLNKLGFKIN